MSYTQDLRASLRHGEELTADRVAERIACTLPQARQALHHLWSRNELERLRIGLYRMNPAAMRHKPKTVSTAWMRTVWRLEACA